MTTFRVTLKRVICVEVDVEADSAADVRALLNEETSDAVLDYFSAAQQTNSDSIKVQSVKVAV